MGNCTSSLDTLPIPGADDILDAATKETFVKALSSKEGTEEAMEKLIAAKINVNHKLEHESIGSCYPLHIAAKMGNEKAVELLLKGEADPNLTDSNGKTPLHWAVQEQHLDIVDELLKAKPDVNAYAQDEVTPLHLAVMTDNEDLVEKLIKAGAVVNPEKGEAPLVTAVKGNFIKSIMPLLKASANPVGLDFKFPADGPSTMLDWAKTNKHDEIAKFLEEKFPDEETEQVAATGACEKEDSVLEKEDQDEDDKREGGDGAEDAEGNSVEGEPPSEAEKPDDADGTTDGGSTKEDAPGDTEDSTPAEGTTTPEAVAAD